MAEIANIPYIEMLKTILQATEQRIGKINTNHN